MVRTRNLFGLVSAVASISSVAALGSQCSGAIGGGSAAAGDPYWMQTIKRNGTSPFNPNTGGYKVYRNVKDYGAKGDGVTDDSAAINSAITDGSRCGNGTCHSSTVVPALVYFPAGTYLVSVPILPYYYTALVGDFKNRPTLKAAANFNGIAVIDTDYYIPGGNGDEWYVPVNNFFRSVRNFVIDTTAMPSDVYGTGFHWQVGQATSLINVHVELSQVAGNKHQGIFMENGSGGFMADLSFNGGAFGMWISNQQFTIHNVKISNAAVGVYQLWNWGFTYKNIEISNCGVGFDMNTGGLTEAAQTMGGDVILDSTITNTPIAFRTSSTQTTSLGGSLFLQNVKFNGVTQGLVDGSGIDRLGGGTKTINQFVQGNVYSGSGTTPNYTQATLTGPNIPASLLNSATEDIYFRTRPQYENYAPSQFVSVKDEGAAGDGKTDDTNAIQAVFDKYYGCRIIYFDAGTYLVSNTIVVPTASYVVGEFWSTILASGSAFSDAGNPRPVLRVGNAHDRGQIEISDLVVTTTAGSAGAIGIEWYTSGDPGAVGMWDVHVRIGGAIGTGIQVGNCPASGNTSPTACQGAFLGFHVASTGGGYFENVWVWAADHDLDDPGEGRINAYSARGIFIDNTPEPVWLVGTASEHHTLYQYSIVGSQNVYAGMIQTETPYYQPSPLPPLPFSALSDWDDPSFSLSGSAWGLVVAKSSSVFIYGAGLYSFFQTYSEACKPTVDCQKGIALVDDASAAVFIYGLNTIGATTMLTVGTTNVVAQSQNRDGLQATMTVWSSANTNPPPPPPTYPDPVPCPSVYAVAKTHIDNMQTYWVTDEIGDVGFYNSPPDKAFRLWTDIKLETLYNYMLGTSTTDYDTFTQSSFPDPGFASPGTTLWNNLFNKSYDDALWTALMYFKVGDWRKWQNKSDYTDFYAFGRSIHDYVAATWSDDCGGGVFWSGDLDYKNTVVNGLFLVVSSWAYERGGDNSYRDYAVKTWDWLYYHGDHVGDLWGDGIHFNKDTKACSPDGTLWLYNQGLIASGLGGLYHNTGGTNTSLLDAAEKTINATFADSRTSSGGVLKESCDEGATNSCTGTGLYPNGEVFKGLFMKHLQYYIDYAISDKSQGANARYARYISSIAAQYSAVIHFATNAGGDIGTLWWEPYQGQGSSVYDGYSEGSGIDAIICAAKYGACPAT
ncbi:putative glycoside hydrolase family 55 protein [Lyophyllum shimeji]|uniref:Glycoside hydrolase family 55 protein n=1 Tax=Lyophyllum shimeji TaxID=47721 RepID=A0A9P3PR93_LYOSH|nr:putative glycoside hydrolase family 55 protein [Lyophyllum shimeji]